jgi:hypothetical protein
LVLNTNNLSICFYATKLSNHNLVIFYH